MIGTQKQWKGREGNYDGTILYIIINTSILHAKRQMVLSHDQLWKWWLK